MKTDTKSAVHDAIHETFPGFKGSLKDDMSAFMVPGWDSFSHVQLMLAIEEKLGTEIEISETFTLTNIGDLIVYLDEKRERSR